MSTLFVNLISLVSNLFENFIHVPFLGSYKLRGPDPDNEFEISRGLETDVDF